MKENKAFEEGWDKQFLPPPDSRIVLVGGAGAIGSEVAVFLHKCGCEITVLDTKEALVDHGLPSGVDTRAIDLADESSIENTFTGLSETLPSIDGLVVLSGFTLGHESIESLSAENWDAVHQVNIRGVFLTVRAALPLLRRATQSSVVLLSSGLAIDTMPGYAHYGAAKAGLISLTRAIAREYAPNIRANAVAPGAVDTAFLRGGTGRQEQPKRFDSDAYAKTVPLGRVAEVSDIVGPIVFLLGDGASYITGQTIIVDGGRLAR